MTDSSRILLVENTSEAPSQASSCLLGADYHVDLANTVSEAQSLSLDHVYDVVITEMMLDDGNGLDLIRHLYAQQPDATFLMFADTVTNDAHRLDLPNDDQAAALISQILFRPWSDKQLMEAVGSAVRMHRARISHSRLTQTTGVKPERGVTNYNLLIIEDDELDAALIKRTLRASQSCRFVIHWAERLSDAMRILEEEVFDAILSDLSLPDARGLTSVAVLRQATETPVIVMSGMEDPLTAIQTIQMGAQDFILKGPSDPTDVTQRIRFAIERSRTLAHLAHLAHLAWHHPLTGLPNRGLFRERLGEALKRAKRNDGLVGVLFVDLDGFKIINDTLGHDAGDVVLIETARRLQLTCRESDTAAHLGGDEFALILEGLSEMADATMVAERVVSSIATPFPTVHGVSPQLSASVGIAWSTPNEEMEELIRRADAAMYRAKRMGKNRARAWSASLLEEMKELSRSIPAKAAG